MRHRRLIIEQFVEVDVPIGVHQEQQVIKLRVEQPIDGRLNLPNLFGQHLPFQFGQFVMIRSGG